MTLRKKKQLFGEKLLLPFSYGGPSWSGMIFLLFSLFSHNVQIKVTCSGCLKMNAATRKICTKGRGGIFRQNS
jgi:hypothetical protein